MYSITIKMLYKIRSIAYCTCILKGGLGTLNSWVLCHFLKAKSQSILWFRILSFVVISSQRGCVISQKKSSANKITNNFWRFLLSESKQKQNSKLVGPHQSFILHSNPKMECLTVFILIMLYFCERLHQKLIYYSKLWEIEESVIHLNLKKIRHIYDLRMLRIWRRNFPSRFTAERAVWGECWLNWSCRKWFFLQFKLKWVSGGPPVPKLHLKMWR